jgi:hypothetical protein
VVILALSVLGWQLAMSIGCVVAVLHVEVPLQTPTYLTAIFTTDIATAIAAAAMVLQAVYS